MLVLYFLLFCAGTLAYVQPPQPLYDLKDAESIFEDFIKKYNKVYANEEEKQERFNIFKENLRKINELRQSEKGKLATFDVNHIADWTEEEFQSRYLGLIPGPVLVEPEIVNVTMDLPESFDWRQSGFVGPVKNQQQCGSCWAFSTTGGLESAYAIKHKNLLSFSEQQIIDCDSTDGGCNGGFPYKALQYVQSAGGIESESDYPYEMAQDQCRFDSSRVQAQVVDQKAFQFGDVEATKQALVQNGPMSICVNAASWSYYTGGIYNCPDAQVDHAVLLVGYGTENGVPFWTIKNSWGPGWGEQGYIRIKQGPSVCGMNSLPGVVPVVA